MSSILASLKRFFGGTEEHSHEPHTHAHDEHGHDEHEHEPHSHEHEPGREHDHPREH